MTLVVTAVGALPLAGRGRALRGSRARIALITAALLVSPVVLGNTSHEWEEPDDRIAPFRC